MNRQQLLLANYNDIEKSVNIIDSSERYKNLLGSNGSMSYPIQRWFKFKESFSIDLLESLIRDWKIDIRNINNVLDPFCGVGTSFLALQYLSKISDNNKIYYLGFERNPFLHFVAATKAGWNNYNSSEFNRISKNILSKRIKNGFFSIPELTTLGRKDVYSKYILNKLILLRNHIMTNNIKCQEKQLILLAYASILENVSGLRKDGRALRIIPNKRKERIDYALGNALEIIDEDLNIASNYYEGLTGEVILGDGRSLKSDNNYHITRKFDLIFYSPPYLNNIDYTEVYKIELWLCNFVRSREEFKSLRQKTFRSHPSVKFKLPLTYINDKNMTDFSKSLDVLKKALPLDGKKECYS